MDTKTFEREFGEYVAGQTQGWEHCDFADLLAELAERYIQKNKSFRDILGRLPSVEKVSTALAAIGAMKDGDIYDDKSMCRCDPEVNYCCEYCALFMALAPVYRVMVTWEAIQCLRKTSNDQRPVERKVK